MRNQNPFHLLTNLDSRTPEENLLLSYFFNECQEKTEKRAFILPINSIYKKLTGYSKTSKLPDTSILETTALSLKQKGFIDFEIIDSKTFGASCRCFALNTMSCYLLQASKAKTFTTVDFVFLQHKNLNFQKVSVLAEILRLVAVAKRKKSLTCSKLFKLDQNKTLSWLAEKIFPSLKKASFFTDYAFKIIKINGVESIRLEFALKRGGKKAIQDREKQERKLDKEAKESKQEEALKSKEEPKTEQEQEVELSGLAKFLKEVEVEQKEKQEKNYDRFSEHLKTIVF